MTKLTAGYLVVEIFISLNKYQTKFQYSLLSSSLLYETKRNKSYIYWS